MALKGLKVKKRNIFMVNFFKAIKQKENAEKCKQMLSQDTVFKFLM